MLSAELAASLNGVLMRVVASEPYFNNYINKMGA